MSKNAFLFYTYATITIGIGVLLANLAFELLLHILDKGIYFRNVPVLQNVGRTTHGVKLLHIQRLAVKRVSSKSLRIWYLH